MHLGEFIRYSIVLPPTDEPRANRLLAKVYDMMPQVQACMINEHVSFSNITGPREVIYFADQPGGADMWRRIADAQGFLLHLVFIRMGQIGLAIVGDKTPAQPEYLEVFATGFI